jgi:hypothetical protein
MAKIYTVAQGDYVASIAADLEVRNPDTIWNDPSNAPLKSARISPNVLFPGDAITIPDPRDRKEGRPTDSIHNFAVLRRHVQLRVVLHDAGDRPVSGAQCLVELGARARLTSDGGGLIAAEIDPAGAHVGTLTIGNSNCPLDGQYEIRVGHLNPVSKPSGQMARLNNLGYRAGDLETGALMDRYGPNDPSDPIPPLERMRFRSAIEEFQCNMMGPSAVDGICGPQTQAKLKQVYGC